MKISFAKLGSQGRLGNQCFQVMGTLGLAEKYNAKAFFPDWKYEQYFETPLPHGETQTTQVKERHFHYHDWQLKESCDISGYLQSEKYFPKQNPFVFKKEFINKVKSRLPEQVFEKPTIAIQIRRGDMVGNPNYYQTPVTFYIDALLTYFPDWEEHNIIFFSDDLGYCKIHFECLPHAYFTDNLSDIESLCLATLCDHFIISNSSFGWWGAWLGEKPHSKIIHSGQLLEGKLLQQNNPKDYYPERWINHKKDNYKLDLKDCTFTIPVFMDHLDRKKNLELCICMLQQSFDTNIIIGEQGKKNFSYMAKYAKYVFFDYKHFHRTKMLNEMAMMAKTPIIANWDADIILPPLQVYLTCEMLRNGSDMVFPYDGRFARMNRMLWFNKVEKHLDIGIIGDAKLSGKRGREIPENSVGGAVFHNKETFIEGGMENENMISFGPEDCERNDRFKALGFKVDRTGGCLYHMDHWTGVNSNTLNPFFKANHAELDKIRGMLLNQEQLKAYIKSWAWYHKYTGDYYGRISEGAIRSAKEVYNVLKTLKINPSTVIDIGCGVGEWNNGIKGYVGLDWNVPKRNLLIPADRYINFNLESEAYHLNGTRYDLALCLEVAEHLSPERAEPLINMLCTLSDKVLFSAAIKYQGGEGHVNEQPASYWANIFRVNGFYPYKTDIRKLIFHNDKVENWYKQNMILYTKEVYEIDYEIDFVHPKYYTEIVKHLHNTLKALQV